MKAARRGLALALVSSLLAYGGYVAAVGSSDLLYPPRRHGESPPPGRAIAFLGEGGVPLVGRFVPSKRSTSATVVLLHGFKSNKESMLAHYGFLSERFHLLAYDARRHGESGGERTTLGLLERRDLMAALDQAKRLGGGPIGLLGVSMGGATAISAAPLLDERVKAIVSDCAFSSFHGAIAPRAALRGYPLPDFVAWSVWLGASLRAGADLSAEEPLRHVAELAPRPLLLIHGLADTETPPEEGTALYQAAREPKVLWTVPGAGHAESDQVASTEYRRRVAAFFDTALREGRGG